MKRLIRLGCLCVALALHAAGAAAADTAVPLDHEVRDAAGQTQRLDRLLAGQAGIVILADATVPDTAVWLARTLAVAAPAVQRHVVVVLASHRPLPAWPAVDLTKFPTVRVYMDAQGALARAGVVHVFPSVLLLTPDGAVRQRMAGPMAVAVNLNALAAHGRVGAAR